MRNRIKTILGVVAGASALALGGSVIASATQATTPGKAKPAVSTTAVTASVTAPETDKIQSGDQTTPDTGASAEKPDTGASAENPDTGASTEKPDAGATAEATSPSDGPGGHQDPAGNVDNQSQSKQ